MAEEGTSQAEPIKGARFTISTPTLFAKLVDLLDDVSIEDRDTKGDLNILIFSHANDLEGAWSFCRTEEHAPHVVTTSRCPRPFHTMAPDLIASNNEVVVHYAACQTRLRICAASAALSWGRKRP
jgi:hypothetical protein